jgi:hypothetical protein
MVLHGRMLPESERFAKTSNARDGVRRFDSRPRVLSIVVALALLPLLSVHSCAQSPHPLPR